MMAQLIGSGFSQLTVGDQTWHYGWLEGRLVSETHYATPTAKPLLREYIYPPKATTPTAFYGSGTLVYPAGRHAGGSYLRHW